MADIPPELPVPSALTEAARRWRERGVPLQPPSRWSRGPWLKQFPSHRPFLEALPEHIDRAEATHHAARAVTPEGAELAFLVTMVWGYGPAGYGAWRTARVLDRLFETADTPHATKARHHLDELDRIIRRGWTG